MFLEILQITWKHLCLRPATLFKKRLWHRCFPLNFAKFLRTPFLQNTSGRLLLIIPDWLFDERKLIIQQLPFPESNEKFTKTFIKNKKLIIFINTKYKLNIIWNTRNIRSLFQIKNNVKHYSCVIYEGNCSCGGNDVGKFVRNVVLRCAEREDPNKQSEPAKHLKYIFLTISLNGKYWPELLNSWGKEKF